MPHKVGQRTVYWRGEKRDILATNLPEGEVQDYNVLKAAAKTSGKPFEDPEFDISLSDWTDGIQLQQEIEWKRPKELNKSAVFSLADASGKRYNRGDVQQGGLGDCYFLSAMALITNDQNLVKFVVPEDNNVDEQTGIYHFRFWVQGYYFDIVVDDRLPYYNMNDQYVPAFTHLGGVEIWPMVFEKAYAKLYGSYFKIEGGVVSEALQDLTGGIVQKSDVTPDSDIRALTPKGEFGVFLGFGTPHNPPPAHNLVQGHAYALVEFADVKNKNGEEIRLLRMRNPWGCKEWDGDWSDKSPLWDTVSAEDKKRLNVDKDEGEFWISFKQAVQPDIFDSTMICYWLNDLDTSTTAATRKWKCQEIRSTWTGDALGRPPTFPDKVKRPQYLVKLEQDAQLVVSLIPKGYIDGIKSDPNVTFFRVPDKLLSKKPPFAPTDLAIGNLEMQTLGPKGKYGSGRDWALGGFHKAGSYLFILETSATTETDYLFRIFSDGKFTTVCTIADAGEQTPPAEGTPSTISTDEEYFNFTSN